MMSFPLQTYCWIWLIFCIGFYIVGTPLCLTFHSLNSLGLPVLVCRARTYWCLSRGCCEEEGTATVSSEHRPGAASSAGLWAPTARTSSVSWGCPFCCRRLPALCQRPVPRRSAGLCVLPGSLGESRTARHYVSSECLVGLAEEVSCAWNFLCGKSWTVGSI